MHCNGKSCVHIRKKTKKKKKVPAHTSYVYEQEKNIALSLHVMNTHACNHLGTALPITLFANNRTFFLTLRLTGLLTS